MKNQLNQSLLAPIFKIIFSLLSIFVPAILQINPWIDNKKRTVRTMKKSIGKLKRFLLILSAVLLAVYYVGLPKYVAQMDARVNKAKNPAPYQVSATAQKLHDSLIVADLHADFLLWNRNFLIKND